MSDRGYEKHVLLGALAGLVTGVTAGLLLALLGPAQLGELVEELLRQRVPEPPPPPEVLEEAVERVRRIVEALVPAAPVLYAVQYALLGALFGMVKGVLGIRLGWGEAVSALAAGLSFVLLFGAVPLVVTSVLDPELVDALSRHFNLAAAVLAPGLLFTAVLVLVSAVRGPWTRLVKARPKKV